MSPASFAAATLAPNRRRSAAFRTPAACRRSAKFPPRRRPAPRASPRIARSRALHHPSPPHRPSRGQLSRTNNDKGVGQGNLNAFQAPAQKRGKNCQPVRLYVKGCFYSFHRCVPSPRPARAAAPPPPPPPCPRAAPPMPRIRPLAGGRFPAERAVPPARAGAGTETARPPARRARLPAAARCSPAHGVSLLPPPAAPRSAAPGKLAPPSRTGRRTDQPPIFPSPPPRAVASATRTRTSR